MNIPKEVELPKIRQMDIERALTAAGNPPKATHEIVLPKCWVYDIPDSWVSDFAVGTLVCYEASELAEYGIKLFDYDTRYDPNATKLAVLPKQVESPLPFE